jgi:hypothetical protein
LIGQDLSPAQADSSDSGPLLPLIKEGRETALEDWGFFCPQRHQPFQPNQDTLQKCAQKWSIVPAFLMIQTRMNIIHSQKSFHRVK